ncbi:MAG: hypothetical protein U0802_04860 [Candidatus Binatia bacterium]
MALATSRRLRLALLLAVLLLPSAGGTSQTTSPVYIWRDAGGAVRFSAPAPVRSAPR